MDEEKVVSTEVAEEAVQAESTEEPKTEEVVETPEETPPPKKKTAQERIDELTRKRREAERDAEYWKNKALQKEESKPAEPPSPIPKRPTLDQFETTEQYEDALFEWRDKKREIEQQAEKQKVEQEAAFRTFQERAQKLREENEDFDEVIERPVFSPAMRDALLLAENGPALAYHLGNNPAEAKRIQGLPVVQQLLELGRLETKMILAKQTKKTTAAPEPIRPTSMSGTVKEKSTDEMTTEEWMAWDRQREREKLKKKYGG
jgi:hypothetical protein